MIWSTATSIVAAMVFAASANASILRCQAKSIVHGNQERRIDVVIPENSDYRYDTAVVDKFSSRITKLGISENMIGKISKGIGFVEIRTLDIYGKFSPPERYRLVVFGQPELVGQLNAIFFREGIKSVFPGMVVVDLAAEVKTITIADAVHLPGLITLYKGTCN